MILIYLVMLVWGLMQAGSASNGFFSFVFLALCLFPLWRIFMIIFDNGSFRPFEKIMMRWF
jgi:hypothetical protein